MIRPKKRETWGNLGSNLKCHIKQLFDDKEFKSTTSRDMSVDWFTQRSVSDYNLGNRLKAQQMSFIKNKENSKHPEGVRVPVKVFLEDGKEQQNQLEQQEWKDLALEFSSNKLKTDDQALSPIRRLKSKLDETEHRDICRLQGHENNQIKYICTYAECPYKYQKACAHCAIKLHPKHIDKMSEIDQLEQIIEDNYKQAEQLVNRSTLLINKLQCPLEEFFQQLKEALCKVLDDVERRLEHKNREKMNKLVKQELDQINQFNTKFEAYKMDNQVQIYPQLLTPESLASYEQCLNMADDKLKPCYNIDELKTLVESNLMTMLGYDNTRSSNFNTPAQNSRMATPRESPQQQISKTTSFLTCHKFLLSPRSPLNVFNQNINTSRHAHRIISSTTNQIN